MRSLSLIAICLLGCGGASAPPQPPAAAPPAHPPVEAEVVTDLVAPVFGRPAAILHTEDIALTIDEAGLARHTGNPVFLGQTDRWIPFSEPVDDVVFLTRFSHPRTGTNVQHGKMFCARTRTASLECVIHFEATAQAVELARRFRLIEGGVEHIGVLTPWPGSGGPTRVICARGTATSCWSFDWDGMRAERYTADPALADAAALRIAPEVRAAWQQAAPAVTAKAIREIVHTDRTDRARIIGPDANLTVHCARLEDGELSCFGPGVYGELGDGTLALTPRASRPLGDAKVVDVAAAARHICAATADGRVACWGDLYDSLPLPKGHTERPLPMCPLDRATSTSRFSADRRAAIERAQECAKGCDRRGRDGCLGCTVGCTKVPYVFKHDVICQEPYLDGTLAQRGMTCFQEQQTPQWLTDVELRDQTSEVALTLSPVYLSGITDAVAVSIWGPTLCVVRRGGTLACIDDDGKLSTTRSR